jgi:hypothetical protein
VKLSSGVGAPGPKDSKTLGMAMHESESESPIIIIRVTKRERVKKSVSRVGHCSCDCWHPLYQTVFANQSLIA